MNFFLRMESYCCPFLCLLYPVAWNPLATPVASVLFGRSRSIPEWFSHWTVLFQLFFMQPVKVKKLTFTLQPATKAQRCSFFNLGVFVENSYVILWRSHLPRLYSVGGRWVNECGAMVEWHWQGKAEVLGEKHYTAWVVDEWMSMEQWWNGTDREKLKYWEKNIIQRGR